MRFSFQYSITALSTEPTISGPASVLHYLAGQRPKVDNPYGSSPGFLIPALRWLLTASFSLLIFFSTLAQNYNAGIGSGTGGAYNVMVGSSAGRITTGSSNSFLGFQSGYSNTTGYSNSFMGFWSGYSNTTGGNNSFVGYQSGFSNTRGKYNSFVGWQAGYSNITGNSNSFLGSAAGYSNTEGSDNSFIGYQAGYRNITGYSNSFVGMQAGYYNRDGISNSFLGAYAGYNTTGNSNSFLGYAAGLSNTTGSNNLLLGSNTNASMGNLSNAGAIGWRAYVSASNSLVLGSINGVNGATASTNVGIGTSAPAYLLHVNGNAAKPGGGSWTVASDRRLKKNVSSFSEGLDVLTKVKPVWFEYNGEAAMPTDQKYVGVIAQEMQKIAPYTVGEFTYRDTTGKQEKYLDYDANALTYILVNAVKEQQGQMEQLNTRLQEKDDQMKALRQEKDNQIESLEARIDKLEQLLSSQLPVPSAEINAAAQLYQNAPNPTEGTTVIGYFLPQEATSAQLKVYSVTGVEVQRIELKGRGKGQVRLSVGQLAAGQYIYHLIVDGQSIASRKLLLNR